MLGLKGAQTGGRFCSPRGPGALSCSSSYGTFIPVLVLLRRPHMPLLSLTFLGLLHALPPLVLAGRQRGSGGVAGHVRPRGGAAGRQGPGTLGARDGAARARGRAEGTRRAAAGAPQKGMCPPLLRAMRRHPLTRPLTRTARRPPRRRRTTTSTTSWRTSRSSSRCCWRTAPASRCTCT